MHNPLSFLRCNQEVRDCLDNMLLTVADFTIGHYRFIHKDSIHIEQGKLTNCGEYLVFKERM